MNVRGGFKVQKKNYQRVKGLPGHEEVNMGRAWESWFLLRYL